MSWLEKKYINLLGPQLRNFKRKSNNLWNFSCVFCGDSAKDKRRAGGYVYDKGGKLIYHCHNCSLTTSIAKLIKHVSPMLHEEYVKELMMEKYQPTKVDDWKEKELKLRTPNLHPLIGLDNVRTLKDNHPCKEYVIKRQIPEEWYSRLWYADRFMEWTNHLIPEKFSAKALKHDSDRLIIPLISKDKKTVGYQGRSIKEELDKYEQKYYTIILDESQPKIFGLDRVDLSRKHYVLEGPIDAMFIPNAIATTGNALFDANKNSVFVFDNEPRSQETCKKIQKAIKLGYKVCIWPNSLPEKDVNEMVINGCAPSFIKQMIDERTYVGLGALVAFSDWKKEMIDKKWDRRFIDLAKHVAQYSKDPSTKCGCVIVRPDKTVASLGYNGFPRGIEDKEEWLNNREEKYKRVIHGEMNAILNAREPLNGYTLYTYPGPCSCDRCAVHIIQAGIKRIVAPLADQIHEKRWGESIATAKELYKEAGVSLVVYT